MMDALLNALIDHGFTADEIIFPSSAVDLRILNLHYPVIPRVVVTPRTAKLVAAAVKVANRFDLKVEAKSGGHRFASYSLGGVDGHMVVDLKHFTEFHMDRDTWEATVGPAVQLKQLVQLLHDNGGRVVPHGVCPTVAIGGEI
jgi:FAD/FMN-containing dehydrogenase